MAFTSIELVQGSDRITIGRSTKPASYTNGGISISLLEGTIKEEYPEHTNNLLEELPYKDVNGSFSVKLEGPTTSGVMLFAKRITNMLASAKDAYENRNRQVTELVINTNVEKTVLTSASYTYKDIKQADNTKHLIIDVEYTRRAIIGTPSEPSLEFITSADTRIDVPYNATTSNTTGLILPSPLSVGLRMFNQDRVFPSGLLLVANQPIISISGSKFYNNITPSTRNPTTVTTINEDRLFPYSTYNSSTEGILRFLPTNTNTITTSGYVFGNGEDVDSAFGVPFTSVADVYLVYRTTVSGTLFNVQLNTFSIYTGTDYSTPVKTLPHSTNPTIAYLGTTYPNDRLSRTNLSLSAYVTGLVSGVLLIDRVILHPVEKYAGKSVQISKLSLLSKDINNPDTPTLSGNLNLEILSNYANPASVVDRSSYYPTLRTYRTINTFDSVIASKIPTYQGNISLFYKPNTLDMANDSMKISLLYLTTGSTYDSVSGMANWTLTNRIGQKTLVAWRTGYVENPALLIDGE